MVSEKGFWKGKNFTSTLIKGPLDKSYFPIKQVSGICFTEEGKILLIKHPDKDYWALPGGTPELKETPEETLVREVDEEASCDIKPDQIIGIIKVDFPDNPNTSEGKIFYQLRYVARIINVKERTQDPAVKKKLDRIFVSPEEFLTYVTWTKGISQAILERACEVIKDGR